MRIDRYPPEDVCAPVPELAAQTDPGLLQLDRLLEHDLLFQQGRADLVRRSRLTAVHGRHSPPPRPCCACSSSDPCLAGALKRPQNG
jgi:IS5 family transposase